MASIHINVKSMNPKVSVIVPNYNHAPYLKQRIDSILNQTYQDFELILLDDCSTDNSREVLESYRSNSHVTHIVFNDQNGGTPFRQWDKGVQLAKGEWVWIAESDDVADVHFLETLLEALANHPSAGFAYAWTFSIDTSGLVLEQYTPKKVPEAEKIIEEYVGREFISKRLSVRNNIDNVSECIFKKNLINSVSDKSYMSLKLCGDWSLYVQIIAQTNVIEVKIPLSYYRRHQSNTTNWTEKEGLTFKEGILVYDRMRNIIHYSYRHRLDIARYWLRNSAIYNYSDTINADIRSIFLTHWPVIVIDYYILSIWRKIKKIITI